MNSNYENDRSALGVVKDPTIKFKPGKILSEYLETSSKFKFENLLTNENLEELQVELHEKGLFLCDLMRGTELIIPKLEIPERNPELEKRVQGLRNALANKEYQKMTKNVDLTSHYKPEDSIGYQIKQMNSGLIAVFQFVVSIAAAFLFGFLGIDLLLGMTLDLAVKLLLGIICALIVGSAELYFLAKNMNYAEMDPISPAAKPRPRPRPKVAVPVTMAKKSDLDPAPDPDLPLPTPPASAAGKLKTN